MDRRRPSYASVAGGNATSSSPGQAAGPVRSGAFAHLMNPTSSTSFSYSYSSDMDSRVPNPNHHHLSNSAENVAANNAVLNPASLHSASSWAKAGSAPAYWSTSALGSYGVDKSTGTGSFLRPTYLRGTRYMEKLEAANKARLAAQRELSAQVQQHNSNSGSLSTSSSSVSLHRMAPSHRGMTYEIVENSPVIEEDTIPPLPSQWKEHDRSGGLEISPDGLDLRCSSLMKGQDHEAAAARTDHPMPPQCGIYYYEVAIISKPKEGMVGIGFSGSKASLEKLPGWEPESWAYHGDDGKSYCCQMTGRSYGPTFTAGDVVGCGFNFKAGTGFFTKNGVSHGTAFKDVKDVKLYPSIGMKKSGTHVKVNFGQSPFMFDMDGLMARERAKVKDEINKTDVSTLHPPLDESALCKELIAQFLRHDGYVETAKAFADEMRTEANSLRKESESIVNSFEIQQDIDAVNRQQIRSAILDGDIDKALKRTNAYYPFVLRDNPDIYFRLRCRKFVEMMRLSTDPGAHSPRGKGAAAVMGGGMGGGTNGHHAHALSGAGASDEIFEQDMELDEPPPPPSNNNNSNINSNTGSGGSGIGIGGGGVGSGGGMADDWDTMDTEETDGRAGVGGMGGIGGGGIGGGISGGMGGIGGGFQDRMTETLEYGKSLQKQYKDDRTKDQALRDIFALFAYEDPGSSPPTVAQVMDPSGRIPVAEELNSAILVSLGKSSSAAIERLCQQTDVLVAEVSDQRGAGAFVNIHCDLLS